MKGEVETESRFDDMFPYEVSWTGNRNDDAQAEVDCWTHLHGAEYKHDFDDVELVHSSAEMLVNNRIKIWFKLRSAGEVQVD